MWGAWGAWKDVLSEALKSTIGECCCIGPRDSEHFIFCCSESGTFLGLGTVTGSVAIYIAFSLQVMGKGGHSPEGSLGWGLWACSNLSV